MIYKEKDLLVCRLCGGNLIEKEMLWYGDFSVRLKCLNCGMIY